MTNREFGRAYIEDARVILAEAEASLEQGHFHRTVRKCQESVEMALKGLLRMAGIEYPKAHRVGRALVESAVAQVVPAERLREIARIAEAVACLCRHGRQAQAEVWDGAESSGVHS
jgi:HEPN domain-containing protein